MVHGVNGASCLQLDNAYRPSKKANIYADIIQNQRRGPSSERKNVKLYNVITFIVWQLLLEEGVRYNRDGGPFLILLRFRSIQNGWMQFLKLVKILENGFNLQLLIFQLGSKILSIIGYIQLYLVNYNAFQNGENTQNLKNKNLTFSGP